MTNWRQLAECRGMDPDLFHPEQRRGQLDAAEAKAVCAICPVREECLEFALANVEQHGIWGGLGERERRRLRRRRTMGETKAAEAELRRREQEREAVRRREEARRVARDARADRRHGVGDSTTVDPVPGVLDVLYILERRPTYAGEWAESHGVDA